MSGATSERFLKGSGLSVDQWPDVEKNERIEKASFH